MIITGALFTHSVFFVSQVPRMTTKESKLELYFFSAQERDRERSILKQNSSKIDSLFRQSFVFMFQCAVRAIINQRERERERGELLKKEQNR